MTSREREDFRLWNPVALREAVINAFVHNDYSKEIPPKFELFSDRIEITSAGGLPEGLSKTEFFEGFSVPRNKELMRIYRDLGLVEQLGSGVPRILQVYSKDCFTFSNNFLRMTFPVTTPQVTPHDTPHDNLDTVDQLILILNGEMHRDEILEKLRLTDRKNLRENYLNPAFEHGLIEYTLPNKLKSKNQKYRLTEKGEQLKKRLSESSSSTFGSR